MSPGAPNVTSTMDKRPVRTLGLGPTLASLPADLPADPQQTLFDAPSRNWSPSQVQQETMTRADALREIDSLCEGAGAARRKAMRKSMLKALMMMDRFGVVSRAEVVRRLRAAANS